MPIDDELDPLRERYPGWSFGAVWVAVPSGPDARQVYAARNGTTLRAPDAETLARKVSKKSE